jgi:hypothetical protein
MKNCYTIYILVFLLIGFIIIGGIIKPGEGFFGQQVNVNYKGNNLSYDRSIGIKKCIKKCDSNASCVGIVTDYSIGNGPGRCWTKSAFANPSVRSNRWAMSKY